MSFSDHNQLLQDCLWCIGSPELAGQEMTQQSSLSPFFAVPSAATAFVQQLKYVMQQRLAVQPDWIVNHLQKLKTRRLGERFEKFCQLAFELHPNYRVLAHNFQVQQDGQTLGELDLLIQQLDSQRIYHLELACKFYLQLMQDKTELWLGPGLKDRLDIKLKRMSSHQLVLAQKSQVVELLKEHGWYPARSCSLLKGRLFYEMGHEQSQDAEYQWGTRQQIYSGFNYRAWQWQGLNKTQWFAPLYEMVNPEPLENLLDKVIERPVQLVAFEKGVEVKRLFLVPDDWREKALHTVTG